MADLRPIRIEGDVAFVPLTRGYEAIIDAADIPLVEGRNWCALVCKSGIVYAQHGARRGKGLMHRVILGAECEGSLVDHRDHNGLNNRRFNLRPATYAQNNHNARRRSDNTSGLKGVCWHTKTGKWVAQIQSGGRRRHLGLFTTPEAAHAAYQQASVQHHGEFGKA